MMQGNMAYASTQSSLHDALQTNESATEDEQDVAGVDHECLGLASCMISIVSMLLVLTKENSETQTSDVRSSTHLSHRLHLR